MPDFLELVIVENTRVLSDAVEKLSIKILESYGRDNILQLIRTNANDLKYRRRFLQSSDDLTRAAEIENQDVKIREYERLAIKYDWKSGWDNIICHESECSQQEANEGRINTLISQLRYQFKNQPSASSLATLFAKTFQDGLYDYDNLEKLLHTWNYWLPDTSEPTDKGGILLEVMTLLSLQIQFDFGESALDNGSVSTWYETLAKLLRDLLDADCLYILLEVPAQHQLWKRKLVQDFNRVVKEKGCNCHIPDGDEDFYELLMLADGCTKDKDKDKNSEALPDEIREELHRYRSLPDWAKRKGYLLDEQDGTTQFVLKIDSSHTSVMEEETNIYIYASMGGSKTVNLIQRIACLLMFYPKLVHNVFSAKSSPYLQELVREKHALALQSRAKAHSHTQTAEQALYLRQAYAEECLTSRVDRSFSESEISGYDLKKNTDPIYVSGSESICENLKMYNCQSCSYKQERKDADVLCLISDLMLSETYRESLTSEYYSREETQPSSHPLGKLRELVKGERIENGDAVELRIRQDNNGTAKLQSLRMNWSWPDVSPFASSEFCGKMKPIEDSELFFYIGQIERVPMFLLALARNALKSGISEDGKTNVFIGWTEDGDIRIANRCDDNGQKWLEDTRKAHLLEPPANINGISLWSVSRYVQAIVAILLKQQFVLFKTQCERSESIETLAKRFKKIYENLTSDRFKLHIDCQSYNGENYFFLDLPILKRKYDNLPDMFKQESEDAK